MSGVTIPGLNGNTCISIIGMAGAGKSTVGRALAERLEWAHVDTDFLIESAYGARLQDVSDALGKEAFLDAEAQVIGSIRVQRAVLSTGGSVVYRPESMQYLASLGPVVYLDVPLKIILERIARKPDRGLAIAPGQTVEDLFHEREILYRHWASCIIPAAGMPVARCVDAILEKLAKAGRSQAE